MPAFLLMDKQVKGGLALYKLYLIVNYTVPLDLFFLIVQYFSQSLFFLMVCLYA